jgi:hypothetical protein
MALFTIGKSSTKDISMTKVIKIKIKPSKRKTRNLKILVLTKNNQAVLWTSLLQLLEMIKRLTWRMDMTKKWLTKF